jgi:GrpB-like predicted nucleotidyltransferase (UPF0157 family)
MPFIQPGRPQTRKALNLAAKPEAQISEPIVVVAYDPLWPTEFTHLAASLREALCSVAVRIDHIGSTAVPGLVAKPAIDIQVSVQSLEPTEVFRAPLERLGYRFRSDNLERTKRYFREPPGNRRTHLHVRRHGSWNEQFALLFRDYLRVHPDAAARYGELKLILADRFVRPDERQAYVEAKVSIIWATMREADAWAKATGWQPGLSDG